MQQCKTLCHQHSYKSASPEDVSQWQHVKVEYDLKLNFGEHHNSFYNILMNIEQYNIDLQINYLSLI